MSVLDDIIEVRRVDVRAGDVLVVRVPRHVMADCVQVIRDQIRSRMPQDVEVLVVTDDIQLEVVRRET